MATRSAIIPSENAHFLGQELTQRARHEIALRAIDVLGSGILLLILAPLMLLIAILVFVMDPGPVLFAHSRVGKRGRSFNCLKFRSMIVNAEAELQALLLNDERARAEWELSHKLNDDPRINGIGRFLRATSLDELPQLFNVFIGSMSLVGPRPVTLSELPRYSAAANLYASVRPGLTGLWQVSGRSHLSYDQRVALDVAYIESRSVRVNLAILWRTPAAVLLGRGAQ